MDKILINPHDCHRDEYGEILKYLQSNSWDYEKLGTANFLELKASLNSLSSELHKIVEALPTKGLKSEGCQKTNILNSILTLEHCINGLEEEDFFEGKTVRVLDVEKGTSSLWAIEEVLEYINDDRSEDWTNYDENDWEEGWNEWIDDRIYKLVKSESGE